jgi:hypothetical protein
MKTHPLRTGERAAWISKYTAIWEGADGSEDSAYLHMLKFEKTRKQRWKAAPFHRCLQMLFDNLRDFAAFFTINPVPACADTGFVYGLSKCRQGICFE